MVTTTERRSPPRTLGLWMNGAYVGSWSLGTNVPDTLQYDPDWTRAEQGRPLSLSLPFMPGNLPHRGPHVRAWFENLLPDSRDIRERMARRYRTGTIDAFDLLAEAGRDCAGALQILPMGTVSAGVAPLRRQCLGKLPAGLVREGEFQPDFRHDLAAVEGTRHLQRRVQAGQRLGGPSGAAEDRRNPAVRGRDRPMPNVTVDGITMINFGMGSANAATMMDLLSAAKPRAALFLGKCGGLKRKNQLGDLILPIAAIRGEGTSNDYLLPEVPALPAFRLQRAVSTMIRDLGHDYWTGTVYTTNHRVWEHDEDFKDKLRAMRCMAIDMETATVFAAGFANRIPAGALLLVSDQPMIPEGVKTEASDKIVSSNFVEKHINIGIEALKLIRRHGKSVKHLRFDE